MGHIVCRLAKPSINHDIMAFRDYSNNDRFDRNKEGYRADPRDFDNRSNWYDDHDYEQPSWRDAHDRAQAKYLSSNWREEPERRGHATDWERHDYYRPPFGTARPYANDDSDPYIRDERRLRERGEMIYGRDYGRAQDDHYYYNPRAYDRDRGFDRDREYNARRDYNRRDRWGSENLDAQQNFERDRPDFRGGGWDQGESMRSRHSQPGPYERDAFERDRGYPNEHHRRSADRRAGYTNDPNAWSSMEHDWNNDHYYGGGRNRTGDYGSSNEPYDWRDNFGKDRVSSRSGRGTTTGWAGGDRSLGSSDLGSS